MPAVRIGTANIRHVYLPCKLAGPSIGHGVGRRTPEAFGTQPSYAMWHALSYCRRALLAFDLCKSAQSCVPYFRCEDLIDIHSYLFAPFPELQIVNSAAGGRLFDTRHVEVTADSAVVLLEMRKVENPLSSQRPHDLRRNARPLFHPNSNGTVFVSIGINF